MRTVGIILTTIIGAVTIFLILWIWGLVEVDFMKVLKGGASFAILGGAAVLFLVVYGMFFWRSGGRQLSLREQREQRERQNSQRTDS
jgi:type VI protein secretion system component VasK